MNALVPGLFPHEDMTADITGNLSRTDDKDVCQPALRVGQRQELGWAATFLASPYARFISGHTLVVDGANWQRRSLTNPPSSPSATRWAAPLRALITSRILGRSRRFRSCSHRSSPARESTRGRKGAGWVA